MTCPLILMVESKRHKVFVSYKFWDFSVQDINYKRLCTPRDYVDILETRLGKDHIYKGEHRDEDLTDKTEDYIWGHLKDKIYDSTVTIVLISPQMREKDKWDRTQWIPWEVRYSLCEYKREIRYSHTNGLIYVVLPNKNGSYDYALQNKTCCTRGCNIFYTDPMFAIMERNMFNRKVKTQLDCNEGDKVYSAFDSYASIVKWCDFIRDDLSMNVGIAMAFDKAQHKDDYDIRTEINRT